MFNRDEAPPVVANNLSRDETTKLIDQICDEIEQTLRERTQHDDLTKRIGNIKFYYHERVPDEIMDVVELRLDAAGWDCYVKRETFVRGVIRRRRAARWEFRIGLDHKPHEFIVSQARRRLAEAA